MVKVKVKYLSDGVHEKDLIENTILTDNDRYYVELSPQTKAYVYVYQIDSKGESKAIFPNQDISELDNLRLYKRGLYIGYLVKGNG